MMDNYVSLLFKDGNEDYVVTAEDELSGDITIKAVENSSGSYSKNAKFVANQFWSYTMFENAQYNQKYLACDSSGKTTLVDIKCPEYPNPQALFILNTV